MFTAMILVCMTGQPKSADVCYTFTHEVITKSVDECESAIYNGLTENYFTYVDPERGERWEPVDFQCVNWNGKRI